MLEQAGQTLGRLSETEAALSKRLAALPAAATAIPAASAPPLAPGKPRKSDKAPEVVKPRADAYRRVADVREGETLAQTAQRHGVRLERIYELNPKLEEVPPDANLTKGEVWIPNDL